MHPIRAPPRKREQTIDNNEYTCSFTFDMLDLLYTQALRMI
jgi:hypothetical protein